MNYTSCAECSKQTHTTKTCPETGKIVCLTCYLLAVNRTKQSWNPYSQNSGQSSSSSSGLTNNSWNTPQKDLYSSGQVSATTSQNIWGQTYRSQENTSQPLSFCTQQPTPFQSSSKPSSNGQDFWGQPQLLFSQSQTGVHQESNPNDGSVDPVDDVEMSDASNAQIFYH